MGDIIVGFNGKPIANTDSLHRYLNKEVIGQRSTLAILRGGERKYITVVPGELR